MSDAADLVEKVCPNCKKKIQRDCYFETEAEEPFVSIDPLEGLTIWGPYSAEKTVLCRGQGFIHFNFAGIEERLVMLGVRRAIGGQHWR